MKTAEEVLAYVVDRIGHVYRRPLMYGDNADGVDLLLFAYHDLWAEIVGRQSDLGSARYELASKRGHCAMSPSTYFRREVPGGDRATEAEAAAYVVDYWALMDEALGL